MDWIGRIGRRLKLRDLHIVMAVAEKGSMSKAAHQLSVSLPVVSKSIADIEHTLGVQLFDRTPQGVSLTAYGHALVQSGAAAFDELQQGVKQIELLSDPAVGEIRIGCNEPFAAGPLPIIIERLRRQHPRIVCHVVQTPTAPTLEFRELRERRVDLIVAPVSQTLPDEDLQVDHLYNEQLYVVAGRHSKWAKRRQITLTELVDEPWIHTPSNTLPTSLMEHAFLASGLTLPRAAVVTLSVHIRNALLPTGRYLSIIPASLLHYGAMRNAVKALPVELPVNARPMAIIRLKHRTLTPLVTLFIEAARAAVKPLAKQGLATVARDSA